MIRNNLNLMESDVRCCFVFLFNESAIRFPRLTGKPKAFRDPAALPIAEQIAEGLRNQGYEATNAKPGKACHASFDCKFDRMDIGIVLSIERGSMGLECAIWSSPGRPLLRGRVPFTPGEIEEWRKLGAEMDRIIQMILKPDSYHWLTFRELEKRMSSEQVHFQREER